MKFTFFSIKYRYSDILLKKKHKLHLNRLFCCNHTYYCVNRVSVTAVSRYITSASCHNPLYQSRSSIYIRGLIPRNFAELAGEVMPQSYQHTIPWHCEEETQNTDSHTTARTHLNLSNQLSLSLSLSLFLSQMISELERAFRTTPQNTDRHKTSAYNGSNKQQQNYRLGTDSSLSYRMGGLKYIYLPADSSPKVMLLKHKPCS